MIQEHWLFQAQIDTLSEIENGICYAGKGVDKYDQIPPQYLPRGFGGVAVLWKSNIDKLVKPLDDGRERIQCIEVKGSRGNKLLLISAYLPSTGGRNHLEEYRDTIDQLYEIFQKYQSTHDVVIGEDLNEDLANDCRHNKRKDYLLQFIRELDLTYENSGKTFIRPNGEECSELDYFLKKMGTSESSSKSVMNNIISNTSDHYPVKVEIRTTLATE